MTATDLPAYSGPTNNLRGMDYDTQTSDLGTGTPAVPRSRHIQTQTSPAPQLVQGMLS